MRELGQISPEEAAAAGRYERSIYGTQTPAELKAERAERRAHEREYRELKREDPAYLRQLSRLSDRELNRLHIALMQQELIRHQSSPGYSRNKELQAYVARTESRLRNCEALEWFRANPIKRNIPRRRFTPSAPTIAAPVSVLDPWQLSTPAGEPANEPASPATDPKRIVSVPKPPEPETDCFHSKLFHSSSSPNSDLDGVW